jgi:CRP-like cAMP-binding protein
MALIRENKHNSFIYLLIRGELAVLKFINQEEETPSSQIVFSEVVEKSLQHLGKPIRFIKGHFFLGENSALNKVYATASVASISDCLLLKIEADFFRKVNKVEMEKATHFRSFIAKYIPELYQVDSELFSSNTIKLFSKKEEVSYGNILVRE